MIYLCSVYSYKADKALMQKRYEYVEKRTATMLKSLITVFSPIVHCHNMAQKYDMPKTFDFWKKHDFTYIDNCNAVYVLEMPHWEKSEGITAEIAYAKRIGKPVRYVPVDPKFYSE